MSGNWKDKKRDEMKVNYNNFVYNVFDTVTVLPQKLSTGPV